MKKGFTLIELLVVVLIIGVLSAVALPQYRKSVFKAKLAQVDVIVSASKKAVESYVMNNGGIDSEYIYITGAKGIGEIQFKGAEETETGWFFFNNGIATTSFCANSMCFVSIKVYQGSMDPVEALKRKNQGIYTTGCFYEDRIALPNSSGQWRSYDMSMTGTNCDSKYFRMLQDLINQHHQ